MSTDPDAQDGAVPPAAASDSNGDVEASPPASLEQICEEAITRHAVITDEWQQARDALLGSMTRRLTRR